MLDRPTIAIKLRDREEVIFIDKLVLMDGKVIVQSAYTDLWVKKVWMHFSFLDRFKSKYYQNVILRKLEDVGGL